MKKYLGPSLKLTLVLIIICSVVYPLLISLIAKATPGNGDGKTISVNGRVVGYERIGQNFSQDKYFNGRPSAVNYNAAGSGGSNKGPSNPDYLKQVSDRIDSFLIHNPGVQRKDIPSELVTASGSGLDPDISPEGARIQIARVAKTRGLPAGKVSALVDAHVENSVLGPSVVNVLRLNVALDELK